VTRGAPALLQGTLDLIILRVLSLAPMHGWGVSQRVDEISGNVLRVNQGSLYPALHRLEGAGLLDADWGFAENGRRVRFYKLTRRGRRQLERETAGWLEYTQAVHLILTAT
jgi:PadR family transcriptional regulator PadR